MKIKVHPATDAEKTEAENWPVWMKEQSVFDYQYGQQEKFYVVEGRAKIHVGEEVTEFKAGDFVIMPQGLNCRWEIIEPIKKHYEFG